MQKRVTANGYMWDYDTEKSQSERVSGEGKGELELTGISGIVIQRREELTGTCGIMIQRRDRANEYLWDYDTEERQREELELTGIYGIIIQRGARADGYLWDYDTEESQS
ncbi:hypothetical protein RRG08_041683 [Elysia crispata]|uniref:Uncharacterized protein n=1 Tax=Elysia crispata TaxID=231223 RepID=A0AAE1CVE4_9GAST|nr:hypothetical protein RRG08_041683 [Elysia crispata]